MKNSRLALGIVVGLITAASANAQRKTLATPTGVLFRYSGDTIWQERDSTITRTTYKGDTVVRDRWMNGRRLEELTFLQLGDSAKLLFSIDSAGARRPGHERLMPILIISSSRQLLASAMRAPNRGANYVPYAPPAPISYCIDRTRNMVQHADTARDIRKIGDRTDTTVYVFIADTTVKRVSPNPATLGYAMYTTLIGEMQMSVVRRNLATRNPAPGSLPGRSTDGCNPG